MGLSRAVFDFNQKNTNQNEKIFNQVLVYRITSPKLLDINQTYFEMPGNLKSDIDESC
jgi:hypothetical protein